MTREQAFEIAKRNYVNYQKADIENLFKRGPDFDAKADYGFSNGWFSVGEYSFSHDEVSGIPYDVTQGGWAFI